MQTLKKSDQFKQKYFWSEFAPDYFDNLYREVKEYPSLVMRHRYILDLLNPSKGYVADIGCGPGEMLCDLLDRGYRVYGVDIAEGMLQVAERNIRQRHPNAEFILKVGNVEALEIESETFDTVICAGVIEYMATDDKTLSELFRILKPGGELIITVRNMACPFRVYDLFADRIKATDLGLKMLNRFKRKRGETASRFIPYRKHAPWKFDANLKRFGFEKKDFRYFHFYPFFAPFDAIMPGFFIKYGLKLEKLSNSSLGFLGSGYIVKAVKR